MDSQVYVRSVGVFVKVNILHVVDLQCVTM